MELEMTLVPEADTFFVFLALSLFGCSLFIFCEAKVKDEDMKNL
jgi:hypothetical protein